MKKIAHLLTGGCKSIILTNDGRRTTSTEGKTIKQSRVSYYELLKILRQNKCIVQKMKSADNVEKMATELLPNELIIIN